MLLGVLGIGTWVQAGAVTSAQQTSVPNASTDPNQPSIYDTEGIPNSGLPTQSNRLSCTDPSGNPNACGESNIASQGNQSQTNQGAGNPINVITGNKYQRENDLPALPGLMGVEIVRHYNSLHMGLGQIGYGWRLSYETDLQIVRNQIYITQADGSRVIFNRSSINPSDCACQNPAQGHVMIYHTPKGDEYTWYWLDGKQLHFNHQGKLARITAPSGESVHLTRGLRGELLKVTDPQGRRLIMHYANQHQPGFKGIVAIDTPVGRYTYHHDNDPKSAGISNLIRVEYPQSTTDNTKVIRHYHYGEPAYTSAEMVSTQPLPAIPKANHLLTGISLAWQTDNKKQQQRLRTWAYDQYGRGVLSVHGLPKQLNPNGTTKAGTGIEQVSISYAVSPIQTQQARHSAKQSKHSTTPNPRISQNGQLGQTILTNSLGQTTNYSYTLIAGEPRLLQVVGAGCAECGETNRVYGYDKLGRLSHNTQVKVVNSNSTANKKPKLQGLHTTHTEYDLIGRPIRISSIAYINGKAQPPQLKVRYGYANTPIYPQLNTAQRAVEEPINVANLPSLVAKPSVVAGKEHQWHITYNQHGQPIQITEHGYRPALIGQHAEPPTAITRTITYRYRTINNRSLLAEVDGPLPNGKGNTPKDSDITQYQYDPRGAYLTQITAPGNTTTQLSYDLEGARAETGGTGRVSQVENSNGTVSSTRYAITGKPIEIAQWYKDSPNHKTRYQYRYDALGKPVEYLINQRPQALNVYDNTAKLAYQASHSGLLTELNYDSQGHPMSVTSRYGQQAQTLDITNHRLNQVQNDVNNAERIHSFNRLGQRVSATSFKSVYDDFGREIYVAHPDYGTLTKRFNANNQLIGQINQLGDQQTFQYNLAGQRVAETITPVKGESVTTRWTYAYGKLTAIHHPQQNERFHYGVQGRLASHTVHLTLQNGKTITHNTRYQYDEEGKLLGHSLPDGSFLQYERNHQDQMVGITRQRSPWTWLGWTSQPIVNNLQRDITGLSHITYGNGVKGQWQRSEQGVLARIRYTLPQQANPSALIHQALPNKLLEYLVSPAYAQTEETALPGALGLPMEADALYDQRLIYSAQGDVLLQQHAGLGIHKTQAYAYNLRHQLVAAQQSATAPQSKKIKPHAPQDTVWRYVYDARGNRLLAQENVSVDEMHQTRRTDYHRTTHQAVFTESHPQHNNMQFEWNVLGQLISVKQHNTKIANYQYNAHGLRIAKHTQLNKTQPSQHTYYLYNLQRQRIAELNSDGHITRQYIWLGDQLVATVDAYQPQPPRAYTSGFLTALQQTSSILWQRLINQQDQLHYVHINHLHAPVAVTDTQARVVWQTDYAPYGSIIKTVAHSNTHQKKPTYQLALRYAGQWQDDETGLYYNDFRYYNPATGRYITPDPLGKMAERLGSPNPYSYVNNNPLSYIDPWGLILFAFDGTGNTEDAGQLAALENGFSNVFNFRELYNDGNRRYISGVGTIDYSDPNRPIDPKDYVPAIVKLLPFATTIEKDMAFNYSGRARVERMQEYFNAEADLLEDDNQAMDVDIIGFSRGAAQARDFANQIMKNTKQDLFGNYWYVYKDPQNRPQCQKVNFRFMGLWDTVLSTDAPLGTYNLHVPEAFQHVAHAIALNEHRGDTFRTLPGSTGAFPLQSIVGVTIPANQTRIEKGFIGAHADIGGGFRNNNELAQVALTWMVEQAKLAGVSMKTVKSNTIIPNPVIHDKSDNQYARDTVAKPADSNEDRTVTYQDGSTVKQKDMTTAGMTWLDTQNFITYNPAGVGAREEQSNGTIKETYAEKPADASVGTVNMAAYLAWLKAHGYTLGDLQVQ